MLIILSSLNRRPVTKELCHSLSITQGGLNYRAVTNDPQILLRKFHVPSRSAEIVLEVFLILGSNLLEQPLRGQCHAVMAAGKGQHEEPIRVVLLLLFPGGSRSRDKLSLTENRAVSSRHARKR